MNQTTSTRFLSYADLKERYGKSRITLWRWVRKGILPPPVQLGPNSIAFSLEEIQEHEARLERRTYDFCDREPQEIPSGIYARRGRRL